MTTARDRVFVKSLSTGEVLWSKDISTPVVEAHGLGGVRIAKSQREAEAIGRGEDAENALLALADGSDDDDPPRQRRDVIVAREGGYMYAMLAAPDADADGTMPMFSEAEEIASGGNSRKRVQRYRISNDRDLSSLSSTDRLLGLGRLPRPRRSERGTRPKDVTLVVTSRDAGLAFLALLVVGIVGYKLGSRPRRRDARRKKVRRRKDRGVSDEQAATGALGSQPTGKDRDGSDTDLDEDMDDEDTRGLQIGRTDDGGIANRQDLMREFEQPIESSTGSSGSVNGGGFNSNRTQSGWMSLGCLKISAKVLGVGSHGTVVYEGEMMPGGRKVAVKRLLRQFFESARKEISLLVELDEKSPHVVRYFAMEEDSEFIYLALELCAASLAERVTQRGPPVPAPLYIGGPPPAYTSRALRQLLQGLADLHRLGVVHRDVKPQNVLITRSDGIGGDVKLADVGLALRLAANRSSYTAVTNAGGGVGTTGWRAPEVLSGGRQTKAVDVFAAGCIVSFVLTGGNHPFGNAIFGRDGNIAAGKPSLEALEALQLPEATDIVSKMIDPVAGNRPCAEDALQHPFFWTDATKLSFLVDISDRLYDTRHDPARYTENFDRYPLAREHCSDWQVRMDMELLMGLGRGYENTVSGLLRVIRNKRNHYSELSASLRKLLGKLPEDKYRTEAILPQNSSASGDSTDSNDPDVNFLTYFTIKVPQLVICTYKYAVENPVLIDQPHFLRYGLKAKISRQPLPLHPFVRKIRESRAAARMQAGSNKGGSNLHYNQTGDGKKLFGYDDNEWPEQDNDLGDSDAIFPTEPNRMSYNRHELVNLQASCMNLHSDIRELLQARELYQPSAYQRNRKRLATNVYEDSDFDPPPGRPQPAVNADTPPGFTRVMPRGRNLYGSSLYGSRASPFASSPPASHHSGFGPSHPLGFSGNTPPGFSGTAPPPQAGNGPPGFSNNAPPPTFGNQNPSTVANTNSQYSRRSNTANIMPTRSQFSGEERIVDFGALRRRKQ
ncbi:Serine/threonine protein kinase/endoribonuclease, ERN [Chondrus crispus]|uniref:non-specific serine/threonine protein kinase n=1 Tax=Chondrus crispus TaxID=2769 RepID=R7QQR5_CHOCR|nr:Serine/threonine protein kinase/endoribonuclease, ERN [Chondrus crispus]CDF40078.1 Serine/threonine protein kinase/endoribonuclease, ERN [Chondrus crispus]|eukprot:XP_005710372.1 Serine/threonine protein kinase/endoribonuclease, ERN [Chondrus crispus]